MPRVTDEAIFAALTDPSANDDCLLWTGRKDEKGYGRIGYRGRASQRAHRVAWEMRHGDIPDGLCVLHRCDTPACVNVDHLFLGTQAENIADRQAKSRTVNPPSRRKLTRGQVAAMRDAYRSGLTQQQIADHFGVSRGNVSRIVNHKSYTEVPA